MTTSHVDYALFALNAYFRQPANQGPVPPGWELFDEFRPEESWTDFSAVAYRRTGTNEVVIAYTGSDSDPVLLSEDWFLANYPAALGAYSPQVQQAIEFYSDVRAAMTDQGISPAMPITLTGHSLGGGLASIVSVLFDQPAKVFDAAPFQLSVHTALGHVQFPGIDPTGLGLGGAALYPYFVQYRAYQQSNDRPIAASFEQYALAHNVTTGFNSQFALREGNVEAWALEDEVLQRFRTATTAIEGNAHAIALGQNTLTGTQLHSMALLTATQLSNDFYSELSRNGALQQLLFDESLYAQPALRTNATPDFLMDLIRNQVGVSGPEYSNHDGNGLLDTFAGDIGALVNETDDLPISGAQRIALLAGIFDYYYLSDFLTISVVPEPFVRRDGVTGGFVFDFTLMADDPANERGRQRMVGSFVNLLDGYSPGSAQALLNQAERWFMQNDLGPLTATGTDRAEVFFAFSGQAVLQGMAGDDTLVGGAGNDHLFGGDDNDVLIGGVGIDVLSGGDGTDYLSGGSEGDSLSGGSGVDTLDGGAGTDTYFVVDAAGNFVTIRDSDGLGSVTVQGASGTYALAAGLESVPGSPGAWRTANGDRWALAGSSVLIRLSAGGYVLLEDFTSGDFGIVLPAARAATPPAAQPGAAFYYADANGPHNGLEYNYLQTYFRSPAISNGTLIGRENIDISAAVPASGLTYLAALGAMDDSRIVGSPYNDILRDDAYSGGSTYQVVSDASGDDILIGGAGNDSLEATGGDDQLFGGDGDDDLSDLPFDLYQYSDVSWVRAPGHSSNDLMYGEAGNDRITAAGGNAFMDGGEGDDELFAGQDDDVLLGGPGNDVLSGDTRLNAGVYYFGLDVGEDPVFVINGQWIEDVLNPGRDVLDGGDGNDILLGGGRDDVLSGGTGDDQLQGDTVFVPGGTRTLFSNHGTTPIALHGNDVLSGGAGKDTLYGGGGNDRLDGGDDDDILFGEDNPDRPDSEALASPGDDLLDGGAGNDQLFGNGGDDRLIGGDGDDYLYSGRDNDVLDGGVGIDYLVGDDLDDG